MIGDCKYLEVCTTVPSASLPFAEGVANLHTCYLHLFQAQQHPEQGQTVYSTPPDNHEG